MVDESHRITGIIDWKTAGWYPDYWQYGQHHAASVQIWRLARMDRTYRAAEMGISGIQAARRVCSRTNFDKTVEFDGVKWKLLAFRNKINCCLSFAK